MTSAGACDAGGPPPHVELIGPGRTLLLRRGGRWLHDEVEELPVEGGARARIQIGDFVELGRGLVIDGTVQLTEAIDGLYTTALVFPAALSAPARRRWLIVGGGDGAAAREALRFRDTESVRVVDVSAVVVEQTQRLIPSFWAGCQRDPRLTIDRRDAAVALRELAGGPPMDVVVYDLSDAGDDQRNPYASSSADRLYGDEAFALARRCLRAGGVFVGQMAELSHLSHDVHAQRRRALRGLYRAVHSYRTYLEPFGYWESFLIASDGERWDPSDGRDVEARLGELYAGDAGELYSRRWHEHLFALHPQLARRLG